MVVIGIFGLVIVLRSEPGRAVASFVCLALLMQCWFTQRRYVKSRERLVLVALALSLPALASVWLGLNVLRFYSYDPVSDISVYSRVVLLQAIIEGVAYAISLVVFFWAIVEISCFLAERISIKLVGRRKTWWNRRLRDMALGKPDRVHSSRSNQLEPAAVVGSRPELVGMHLRGDLSTQSA